MTTVQANLAPPRAGLFAPRAYPWWPIVPAIVFLFVVFLYPVGQLLALSLREASGAFTLSGYQKLLTAPVYLKVMAVTFHISAWTTVFAVLGGYPVAYLIATSRKSTQDLLMILVLLPFWTSFLVRTFAWMILLGQQGAVNNLLIALGITDAPLNMLYSFSAVVISMVHSLMPLAVITMVAVMKSIDGNLAKAAQSLGARGGQVFWQIYFPLSAAGVTAAALLVFITALGYFIAPALLGGARETMITQVLISTVQDLLDWRMAGVLSVTLLVITAVVFWFYDRVLGLATLSGASPAGRETVRRGDLLWRRLGQGVLAGLGRVSALLGELIDRIRPVSAIDPRASGARWLLWTAGLLLVAFLVMPSFIVIPVSFNGGEFIEFPPRGFSFKWYERYFGSEIWLGATVRSIVVAFCTATLSTALGTAAAYVLAFSGILGRSLILLVFLAPMIVPRMIFAVGLFHLYSTLQLVGTSIGLIIGHTAIALPYVVITMLAVLKGYDIGLDRAAWSLGATRSQTIRYVTLPQLYDGMIAAFLFAFVTSFDDLTVSLFVSGGFTATLPRQMWADVLLEVRPTLAAVATVMLVLVTAFILAGELLRRRATHAHQP